MPKFVDHDLRRKEVTVVAAELVATHGRQALTVRNVAQRAGYSTKVVSHYFADVADLLHATYVHAAQGARRRIDAVVERDGTDIAGLLEAVLPLDDERRAEWCVWFAFWTDALASPELAAEQRARARTTHRRIEKCLVQLIETGALPAETEVPRCADRLATLIPGIAAEAVFDPGRWGPGRQRRVIADELRSIGLTTGEQHGTCRR